MNLPSRVKVGAFWYTIEVDADLLHAEGLLGEVILDKLNIRLDDTAAPSVVKTILLHEIIHISKIYLDDGLALTEAQLKALSLILFQVFTENPDIRKFIFEDE